MQGVRDLADRGPANTYSSSRMGLNEDETVKMIWSSSKKGDFEDGSCQQLGFGPAGRISIGIPSLTRRHPFPCGGPIREHRMDAMWLKATMSFVTEGARSSELDAPLLRQTPRSATVASILFVIPLGFEPKTHSLEGCCSIQLSYGTVLP